MQTFTPMKSMRTSRAGLRRREIVVMSGVRGRAGAEIGGEFE
jgi:hypothetical protein